MPLELKKSAVDLGIITNNPEPMLAFYRDLLGFRYEGALDVPGGTTMHRLWCGDSLIKILQHRQEIPAAPSGGMNGATGYRYWTITVGNLDEITAACEEAGYAIAIPLTVMRPGVRISVVEDPDGNWVEFLENS
ncbi:MAG: VOC family protein [Gammaproteobacteria bacterium]|jgi:glyoxylase I family protein|nr:VOC family protein [Gammaproteobacteria bacterium]MBT4492715.1 VOC family protein [Gammaproteobacteria bacterium]MBT7370080.1 VOC family protein [Gammaproteobacteria bacterium]